MQRIGPYTLVSEIARGGMGAVYRARDAAGRDVALKLLVGQRAHSPSAQRRFATEVETHGRLRHPNVIPVRDCGVHDGVPYVVLDFVDGETLEDRLKREGPLPVGDALRVGRGIASALHHAHEHGVVHRDLKPQNVLVDRRGGVWLSDFGLALDLEGSHHERLTKTGHFLGTPGYWAPEQALGQKHLLGPATDVYGLGATLFGLLAGRPPLTGSTLAQLESFDLVPPLESLRPDAPPGLCALVHDCLRPQVQARPRALQVLAEIDRLLAHDAPPRQARNPWTLLAPLLITALVLLAAIAGVLAGRQRTPTPPAAPNQPATAESELLERLDSALAARDYEGLLAELEQHPELSSARALEFRALALIGLDRHSEARRQLDAALDEAPHPALFLLRARLRYDLGDETGALEDFELATAQPDAPHEVLHAAFHPLEQGRRTGAAERAILRAIELAPTQAEYAMDLSRLLEADQRYRESLLQAQRAAALDPGQVEPRAQVGKLLTELGRYAEAEATFSALRRDVPQSSAGLLGLARLHGYQERFVEAADTYLAAERVESFTPEDRADFALVLAHLGRLEEALRELDRVLATDVRAEWLYRRGTFHAELGATTRAFADFERALELEPAHAKALGAILRGNVDEERLTKALAAAPSPFRFLVELGDLARLRSDFDFARELYERALRLDPDDLDAAISLGVCLANLEARDRAEALLTAALESDPRSARAHVVRAANRLLLGRPAEALRDLDAALAVEPTHMDAQRLRAEALASLGRADEAISGYERVLRAAPDDPNSLFGLGEVLLAEAQLDRALPIARRGVAVAAESYAHHHLLGEVLLDLERHEEAAAGFRRVLELAPEHVDAKRQLAFCLCELGRYEEAVELARPLLEVLPDSKRVRFTLATSLRQTSRFAEALPIYESLVVSLPENHWVRFGLGDTHLGLTQDAQAEAAFREAVRLSPDYAPGHYGLGLALCYQKRWASALKSLQRAVALEPGYAQSAAFLAERCLARFHAGEREPAKRELEQLLAANPHDSSLLRVTAELAIETGEAVDRIRPLIERAREHTHSERLLADLDALEARLESR